MPKRVRAIIVINGKVVLIKRLKDRQEYYVFPGGGVENGEDNNSALERECREELGVEVKVGKLVYEKEFAGQKQYFYLCEYVSGKLGSGTGPEFSNSSDYSGGYKIDLMKIENLDNIDLRPKEIGKLI